jgi:hypothetical protein
MQQIFDPRVWAEQQFGQCQLGDRRRTARVVKIAAMMAQNSAASTPHQVRGWHDLKAAYRLFDNSNVTFQQLIAPHRRLAKELGRDTMLVVSDTTEFDFKRKTVKGLKPTGNGSGMGFFLHSALYVRRDDGEVVGIAAQQIFYRQPKPKRETSYAKRQRARESEIWGKVVKDVGTAPRGVRYLHVCDRGADDYEFFCRLLKSGDGWVVRAAKGHRKVVTIPTQPGAQPEELPLQEFLARQSVLCQSQFAVPEQKGQPARTATLELRASRVLLPRPRQCSPWVKKEGAESIEMSAVELREINAPAGVQPLHWMLLSSEPCGTTTEAQQIVTDYEKRPVIEDYHKGMKTGCSMEARQYMTADRLDRVLGVISVTAIRLLQLRAAARKAPDEPASTHVPSPYRIALCASVKSQRSPRQAKRVAPTAETITNREFYRQMAQLGGFIGRKSDGEPGWQTLWRGFEKLHNMVAGHETISHNCG